MRNILTRLSLLGRIFHLLHCDGFAVGGFQTQNLGRLPLRWVGLGKNQRHDLHITLCQKKPLGPSQLEIYESISFKTHSFDAEKGLQYGNRRRLRNADWSFFPLQTYSSLGPQNLETQDRCITQNEEAMSKCIYEKSSKLSLIQNDGQSGCIRKSNLNLVYVDDQIVVVNKPSGVMSVPGPRRQPCILDPIYDMFGDSSLRGKQRNDAMDQMVVHRLDRDTSGLVVFALSENSLKRLHDDFRSREVKKQYIALVCGHVLANEGEINLPLSRDHLKLPFMRVETSSSKRAAQEYLITTEKTNNAGFKRMIGTEAKASFTQFRVMSRELMDGKFPVTRIMLYPETGRTHQLRVHCAAIGHPIVADPIYGFNGEGSQNAGFSEEEIDLIFGTNVMSKRLHGRADLGLQNEIRSFVKAKHVKLCLHAQKLHIWHPTSRAPLSLSAPPSF